MLRLASYTLYSESIGFGPSPFVKIPVSIALLFDCVVAALLYNMIPQELMRSTSCNRGPESLIELPLNVLFRILCFLELEELRNVARCCKLMRILANENLMLTNNLVELNSSRDQWTRRLFFDVFDILNGSRHVLMKLTMESRVSIFDSVRYVQQKCELGYSANESQLLLMQNEDLDFMNDIRDAKENYESGTKDRGKETLTYLKILQGFHNLALASPDNTEEITAPVQDDEDLATPVKNDTTIFQPCPKQTRTISPTTSSYSKSSEGSLFSDLPPKLSDRGWHSSIYELEHVSDHASASDSEDDSSSSNDSMVRLRNSTKVKDKAALFEKLISKDFGLLSNPKKCQARKSYGALSAENVDSRPASTKRTISQGYLKELERCNLPSRSSTPILQEDPTRTDRSISKYQDHILSEYDIEIEALTDFQDDSGKRPRKLNSRISQRSKLKAFVTEDNKICYERL